MNVNMTGLSGFHGQTRLASKHLAFRDWVKHNGWVVIDIRYSANSVSPIWRAAEMKATIGEGQYFHVPALGNVNYKEHGAPGTIQIADMDGGIAQLKAIVADTLRDPLLICACAHTHWLRNNPSKPCDSLDPLAHSCHRGVVGRELAKLWVVRGVREHSSWVY